MKQRKPTAKDIEKLLAYLPQLSAEGYDPIKRWHGGQAADGSVTMSSPEYEEAAECLRVMAFEDCWFDREYPQKDAASMLESEDVVRAADIDQIRTMLTYCARGDRFCEGHWGDMIEKGHVRRLLERLAELLPQIG